MDIDTEVSIPSAADSIVKALDAIALVRTVPCFRSKSDINSPVAYLPVDTDLVKINSEADKQQREEANSPFVVPESDLRAIMVGQGYRFKAWSDDTVFIPDYVVARFLMAISRVSAMLSSDTVTVLFDRTQTLGGRNLMERSPKGWFAAFADPLEKQIYISPTLVRAAFLACGSRIQFDVTLLERLAYLHEQIDRGYSTPSDASAQINSASLLADRFDLCMDEEVDFLLGHELSHALLGIVEEARADCIGSAVAATNGHFSGGIFHTLIFGLIESDDVSLLGMTSMAERSRLACRARVPWGWIGRSLPHAIAACREMPSVCQ
ncbi:MAG: hypothetical protein FHP92_16940 [Denitromonas halophila]|nr:MAG: hypothetical protein FHP92_16940 [Denitromonas halophila]